LTAAGEGSGQPLRMRHPPRWPWEERMPSCLGKELTGSLAPGFDPGQAGRLPNRARWAVNAACRRLDRAVGRRGWQRAPPTRRGACHYGADASTTSPRASYSRGDGAHLLPRPPRPASWRLRRLPVAAGLRGEAVGAMCLPGGQADVCQLPGAQLPRFLPRAGQGRHALCWPPDALAPSHPRAPAFPGWAQTSSAAQARHWRGLSRDIASDRSLSPSASLQNFPRQRRVRLASAEFHHLAARQWRQQSRPTP
jgi:hypothetical protein